MPMNTVNDFLFTPPTGVTHYRPLGRHAGVPALRALDELDMDGLQDKYKTRFTHMENARTKAKNSHADKVVKMLHQMDYTEEDKAQAGRLFAYNLAGLEPDFYNVKHKTAYDARAVSTEVQKARDESAKKEYELRADRRMMETGNSQFVRKLIPSASEERHDKQLMDNRNYSDAVRAHKHHAQAILEMQDEKRRHAVMNEKLMIEEMRFAKMQYMDATREARLTHHTGDIPKAAEHFNDAMHLAEDHKGQRAKQFEHMEQMHRKAFADLETVERSAIAGTTTYLQRFNTDKKREMLDLYTKQAANIGAELQPPAERKARKKKEKKAKAVGK